MRELTQALPKPMLKVQGRPILEHILAGLSGIGIQDCCIVTGWKAEAVEGHFGDGSAVGMRIHYARQAVQNGTGKAPELARDFVGNDPFLLTYGDILVRRETYARMCRRFAEGPFAALLTVTQGQDITQGGLNFFDETFCLKRLIEKPSPAQVDQLRADGWLKPGDPIWYNAGIYLFRPGLFEFTARLERSPRGEYELTDALTAMIAAGQRIAGLAIEGRWVDVRDPEVLAKLEQDTL